MFKFVACFHPLVWTGLVLAWLMAFGNAWAAEDKIHVIPLQHKSAAEIVQAIQPLLDEQDAISHQGQQLLIRSSPASLAEIQTLIEQLDQAPALLLIELQQPISGSRQYQQLRQATETPRLSKSYRSGDRDTAINAQQLQLLDGHSAAITAGRLVPMAGLSTDAQGRTRPVIEHKPISSGFQITPRLIGEQVHIDVAPFAASASAEAGTIHQQGLVTSVRVPLKQWVEIAGRPEPPHEEQATRRSTHDRHSEERSIFIRIQRISD